LSSELFERVLVSTDDEEVARVSRESGAEVPFTRPADLADDYTGTTEVIAHAIEWLQRELDEPMSAVCCIYPTAPFLQCTDLQQGVKLLKSGNWRYVFSATSYASSIFRSFQRDADGGLSMLFPENFETRSQDLPEALHDAGQFYWGNPAAWLARERIFDAQSSIVRIPLWRVQDIDTEEDWIRAEQIAATMIQTGQSLNGADER